MSLAARDVKRIHATSYTPATAPTGLPQRPAAGVVLGQFTRMRTHPAVRRNGCPSRLLLSIRAHRTTFRTCPRSGICCLSPGSRSKTTPRHLIASKRPVTCGDAVGLRVREDGGGPGTDEAGDDMTKLKDLTAHFMEDPGFSRTKCASRRWCAPVAAMLTQAVIARLEGSRVSSLFATLRRYTEATGTKCHSSSVAVSLQKSRTSDGRRALSSRRHSGPVRPGFFTVVASNALT